VFAPLLARHCEKKTFAKSGADWRVNLTMKEKQISGF
jgi:hypothetical protein